MYETDVPGQIATDGKTFVDAVDDVLRGGDEAAAKRQERREQYYEKAGQGAAERVYRAVRDWIECYLNSNEPESPGG